MKHLYKRLLIGTALVAAAAAAPTIASAAEVDTFACSTHDDAQMIADFLLSNDDSVVTVADMPPALQKIVENCGRITYDPTQVVEVAYVVHPSGGTKYGVFEFNGKHVVGFDFTGMNN